MGENRPISVFDVIHAITGEGDLTINAVKIKGNAEEGKKKSNLEGSETLTETVMNGLGVFRQGKLIYWMKDSEARGTEWLLNQIEETVLNIDADDKKESVAVNIIYSRTEVKTTMEDGLPVFHVTIAEEGGINETDSYVDLSKREEIMKLERGLEKKTRIDVMQAFQKGQQLESDIFNFGNELKRTNPQEWAALDGDWGPIFAKGRLDLKIKAYIRSTGMSLKPYIPEGK